MKTRTNAIDQVQMHNLHMYIVHILKKKLTNDTVIEL